LNRRHFLASVAATALFGGNAVATRPISATPAASNRRFAAFDDRLRDLESSAGGRLGVHVLDTATSQEYGYRSDERFMLLSSFKL
jgi:beta-lactamase class A